MTDECQAFIACPFRMLSLWITNCKNSLEKYGPIGKQTAVVRIQIIINSYLHTLVRQWIAVYIGLVQKDISAAYGAIIGGLLSQTTPIKFSLPKQYIESVRRLQLKHCIRSESMETYAYYENDRIFDLYENESRDKYDIGQDLYALLDQSDDHFIPEDFSHGLKVVLAVLYSFLSAGALVGNACVLVVILTHPAIRTVTNTFIVSLAASDALIAAWNMPLQLVFYVRNEWGLGEGMCKVTSFVQGVSILASILTLTGISIER
ncbi:hypothetical protein DPMN_025204 [Dreissena polymorpha]|uniref:G-protein coupled receptors family 1 profile domain-containing protein n=3 Tax=Dreissena polymorpha TaxID=45954 RepID=A0A9D4LPE7_DREPO|nr:hypothetical protein DPMN_025204 [Dreissena polymorpha]